MEADGMKISVRRQDDFAVVAVEGRVVRENQETLRSRLEQVLGEGIKGLALDFQLVDYIDSAGLGCCASVQRLLHGRGGGAMVMFGPSPNIEKMWKLIRLDLAIPIFQKESDALMKLRTDAPTSLGS